MDNIIFENTLYEVDDFYTAPRELLNCCNCGKYIMKDGLVYERIKFRPRMDIKRIHFHKTCFNPIVAEIELDKPTPLIQIFKSGKAEEYFMPSSLPQTS